MGSAGSQEPPMPGHVEILLAAMQVSDGQQAYCQCNDLNSVL